MKIMPAEDLLSQEKGEKEKKPLDSKNQLKSETIEKEPVLFTNSEQAINRTGLDKEACEINRSMGPFFSYNPNEKEKEKNKQISQLSFYRRMRQDKKESKEKAKEQETSILKKDLFATIETEKQIQQKVKGQISNIGIFGQYKLGGAEADKGQRAEGVSIKEAKALEKEIVDAADTVKKSTADTVEKSTDKSVGKSEEKVIDPLEDSEDKNKTEASYNERPQKVCELQKEVYKIVEKDFLSRRDEEYAKAQKKISEQKDTIEQLEWYISLERNTSIARLEKKEKEIAQLKVDNTLKQQEIDLIKTYAHRGQNCMHQKETEKKEDSAEKDKKDDKIKNTQIKNHADLTEKTETSKEDAEKPKKEDTVKIENKFKQLEILLEKQNNEIVQKDRQIESLEKRIEALREAKEKAESKGTNTDQGAQIKSLKNTIKQLKEQIEKVIVRYNLTNKKGSDTPQTDKKEPSEKKESTNSKEDASAEENFKLIKIEDMDFSEESESSLMKEEELEEFSMQSDNEYSEYKEELGEIEVDEKRTGSYRKKSLKSSEAGKNRFQFYRIKNLPNEMKSIRLPELRRNLCIMTGIRSVCMGFITQVSTREVQIAIPKKYQEYLKLISTSYKQLGIESVEVEGPVDPLVYKNMTKDSLLKILKDYAMHLTKNTAMKNMQLYKFCEKVLSCDKPEDFYTRVWI